MNPGISSDGIVNNIIPSMQGFFVHVSNGALPGNRYIWMNNSVRINNTVRHSQNRNPRMNRSLIRLTAAFSTDTTVTDPMLVYIDNKATETFDNDYDALKLMQHRSDVPNLYSVSPDDYKAFNKRIASVYRFLSQDTSWTKSQYCRYGCIQAENA